MSDCDNPELYVPYGDNFKPCGACPNKGCELAASTCFSDHAVAKARRERLRECLETLSVWCARRAGKKHNTDTTITMLSRKVQDIMDSVAKAGRRGLDEYNQEKNSNHYPSHKL